jgi:membrane-bound ClpP family serine protease
MKNPRLIIAIVSTLLDETIIVAVIILGLPKLGVQLPLFVIILICSGFLIWAVGLYTIGSKILRKKPLPGFTNMVGVEGRVVKRLAPQGFIRVQGELWESRAENGVIEAGTDIVVVSQNGLKLVVRQKTPTVL